MSEEITSGLTATRGNTPDMTFVWDAKEEEKNLRVTVRYGGGSDTGNSIDVPIKWGDTTPQKVPAGKTATVEVKGKVTVYWGDYDSTKTPPRPRSYIVTFSGDMVRGGVNNIKSVSDTDPIIVYARLWD